MKNKTVILLMVFLLFVPTACRSEQTGTQNISDQSAAGLSAVVEDIASAGVIQEMISLVKNNDYKKMIVDMDAQDDNYKFLTDLLKDRAIELIELRSMHCISLEEAEGGLSYITVMEENIENLHRILDF